MVQTVHDGRQSVVAGFSMGQWSSERFLVQIIKGNTGEDVSWHENVENEQIFPNAGFVWLFISTYATEVIFGFHFEFHKERPC